MGKRETNKKQRHELILSTSLKLFGQYGVQSVTIDKITDAMDVGKGTVYNYFASKDEIFAHLILQFNRVFLDKLKQSLDETEPVLMQLRKLIESYVQYHFEDVVHSRIIFSCKDALNWDNLTSETKQIWLDYLEIRQKIARKMVDAGVAHNQIQKCDTGQLTYVCLHMVEGLLKHILQDPEPLKAGAVDSLTALATDILLKGLTK